MSLINKERFFVAVGAEAFLCYKLYNYTIQMYQECFSYLFLDIQGLHPTATMYKHIWVSMDRSVLSIAMCVCGSKP